MHLSRRTWLAGPAAVLILRTASRAATVLEPSALTRLRDSLKGRLSLPGDAEYDPARRVASFSPATDKHPRLIVRCAAAPDVVNRNIRPHEVLDPWRMTSYR